MTLETASNLAQIAAFVGAFVYFTFKVIEGQTSINMSLDIDIDRRRSPTTGQDYLGITLTLSKGVHGMLVIHRVEARVTSLIHEHEFDTVCAFDSTRRIAIETDTTKLLQHVDWKSEDSDVPCVRIGNNETIPFSAFVVVPSQLPVAVNVVVAGRRFRSPMRAQWRASAVSMPIP